MGVKWCKKKKGGITRLELKCINKRKIYCSWHRSALHLYSRRNSVKFPHPHPCNPKEQIQLSSADLPPPCPSWWSIISWRYRKQFCLHNVFSNFSTDYLFWTDFGSQFKYSAVRSNMSFIRGNRRSCRGIICL